MAAKQLLYHEDARRKLLRGVNAVANAVRITIGPKAVEAGDLEVKVRKTGEVYHFTREDYLAKVQELLEKL